MPTDHDTAYKLLFSHPELIQGLLIEFIDVTRSHALDFGSLSPVPGSYVSDTGKTRHSDRVWKIKFADSWMYVYLLLEFQVKCDPIMALRMQTYVGLLLQDLDRRGECGPTGKLPPVLPVVLYNGLPPWTVPIELAELLEPMPSSFGPYQPQQRYLLIDQARCDLTPLDSRASFVAALFHLEHPRKDEDTDRVIARLKQWLSDPKYAALSRDFALFLSWQARWEYNDPEIPDMTDLSEVQAMRAERRLPLWQQWKREGVVEGESQLLRRQLAHRFGRLPDWVEAQLAAATEADLLRWSEGIIDAKALDEIFALGISNRSDGA